MAFWTGLVLEDLELLEHVHPIALSEELAVEKPNPEIFGWARKQHEFPLTPEMCLHVGDELNA